ncbi:MAG: Hsp33 family molecular chaperone HslO [Verrucomicrobiota bacterium]
MLNDPTKEAVAESVEIRCYFVRGRNALVARGEFSPIYTDYYLHLMQHQLRYPEDQDQILKDGLAAMTLHLASRPWNEAVAWTLSWQDPPLNVFVTGSNRQGNVTGRVFSEDVKKRDSNLFFAQVTADGEGARQSMVEVSELDLFHAGEQYYGQSEQRLGRYFRHGTEDFVLVTAQPDCDETWLAGLDDAAIRKLDEAEELSLLEKREYRFDCGCSQEKLFPLISSMASETVEELFGDSEVIPASCPRCGARYVVTREALEAYREANG